MKITCITPTYNRYPLLNKTIDMFLKQSHPDKELVIVDDSTHCIPKTLTRKIHKHKHIIKHIVLTHRRSIGYKRNIAITHATGTYVAFWDDDDVHFPERLSLQSQLLSKSNKDICVVDSKLALYYFPKTKVYRIVPKDVHNGWWKYGYVCPSMMFKRSLWKNTKFKHVNDKEDIMFIEQSKGTVVIYNRKHCIFAYCVNPNGVSKFNMYLTNA